MRSLKICSCLLLAGLLLGIAGCAKSAYVKKGPEVLTNVVKINNCKADPDTAKVPKGQTLTWTIDPVDGHSYSIHFPGRKPIASADAPTGQAQTVIGDTQCSLSFGLFGEYGYNLIQDDTKTCPDPGVHVGSGGP